MTTLLEHHIENLRLREDAPFPSEITHGVAEVREIRDGLTLVRCGCPICRRDATDCANWPYFDGESA